MQEEQIKLYFLDSLNPFVNLAYEDYLLRTHNELESNEQILILWKSMPSIVMGKFQNPWIECRVLDIRDRGINLVRRQSGGGCVYHDPGNLNYSFISPKKSYDKSVNAGIIVNALKGLGVDAFENERHDLRIIHDKVDYKFSGCAFKEIRNSSLHHGTLLIDADLGVLNKLLRSDFKSDNALGVKSVRSQVINLSDIRQDISEELIKKAISSSFEDHYQIPMVISHISEQEICMLPDMLSRIEVASSWQHIFGATPKFTFCVNGLDVVAKYARIISVGNNDEELINLVIDKTYYDSRPHEKELLTPKQEDFISACLKVLY